MRQGWKRALTALVLLCALQGAGWARPMPMPTTAAPDDSPVELGTAQPAPITIDAAGKTFHMRGMVFDKAKAGLIPINDPDTRALFMLYSTNIVWSGGAAVVSIDDARVTLPAGVSDIKQADGSLAHLDIPVTLLHGAPYLPVGALPHVLPGKLQGVGAGHYLFDPVVTSIDFDKQEGGGVRLTLESRVPMTHTSFMLRKPNRYVLNLPNVVLDLDRYHQVKDRRLQHPEVGEVRFDQFSFSPNVVRVVIPLKEDQELRVLPRSTPRKMLVTINKASVQAFSDEMSTQHISDVRVERSPTATRLVLKATGPFQYEWHRLKAPDNRFFLDIPKAILAGHRQKLEVNDSWVDDIQVGQYQKEPVPTVRVLLNLEKSADTRILTPADRPGTLVLEVNHKAISEDSTGLNGVGVCGTPFARPAAVAAVVTPTRPRKPAANPHVAVAVPVPVPIPAGNGGGRVICIDPGHGGSDCGALNKQLGIYEKDVTLGVAEKLRRILMARGWHVVMTRTTDRDVTYPGSSATEELAARVRVAYAFHADIFVSIHCNSSVNAGANGSSTHYYKVTDRILAGALHPKVVETLGCPDRGIVRNRFYVLAHCTLPSVLIETAFISNMNEGRKLSDPSSQQRLAEGIADGLAGYVARNQPRKTGMK